MSVMFSRGDGVHGEPGRMVCACQASSTLLSLHGLRIQLLLMCPIGCGDVGIWPNDLIVGDKSSYRYLVESIRKFPEQDQFSQMISKTGFQNVKYRNLSFGIAAIHSGWKI